MKQGFLAFALVMFVACGGDDDGGGGGSHADARPLADGGGGGDGDGSVNPDGGGGGGTPLVWAWGDFATNDRTQLAAFAPDATLPVTPLAVFPAGDTAEIWYQTGSADYGPFDISPDGTKVAFSADIDVADRFDLYVASVDGGEATHVVAVAGEADIEKVRFSPDGSKIAFVGDVEVEGQLDAYVVAADAVEGTPVRVSPAHANPSPDLDASQLAWSTDSTKIVVTGDFTQNDYQEMWIADATVADPEPVQLIDRDRIQSTAVGSKGAIFPLLVDDGKVLFRSKLDADDLVKLTVIDDDGQNEALLANSEITRPADDSTADTGAATLSPDGSKLAFTADETATIYDVWVMPSDGSAAPTKLSTGLAVEDSNPIHTQPLKWSPNGQSIAFLADYASDGKTEPYVLPVGGGGQVRLAVIGDLGDDRDADSIAWTPAGDALFMAADLAVNNDTELYRLDPAMQEQTPALAIDAPASGDLKGVRSSH